MDTLAHGLYGGLSVPNKKLFWWGFIFGNLPDVLVLIYGLLTNGVSEAIRFTLEENPNLPDSYYNFYYLTHSLLFILFLFIILRLIKKDLTILTIPYGLHVLFDIPLHCGRFSTRFLYPLSSFHICGISYFHNLWLWLINYLVLMVIFFFFIKRKKVINY